MADQQETFDYAKMRGTVNGVLDRMEKERNNQKTEIERMKNEITVFKATIDEKESENKKLNEELSAANKMIGVLDPTGTGQRIVDHANLFQTKEIDRLTEKIVSLETKNAEQLKLIELLQRAELDKTTRAEGTNNAQVVDRVNRKRKAETLPEVKTEVFWNEK